MPRRSASAGFTLVEILIAITILVVGVAGILALFPSTIETASRAVDDTYAASIAQSVVETLSAARRDGRVYDVKAPPNGLRYVLFDHDGVLDAIDTNLPTDAASAVTYYANNYSKDYILLLPRGTAGNASYSTEPTCVYPQRQTPTAVNHSPATISAGKVADELPVGNILTAWDGSKQVWIDRVYPLGRYREGQAPTGFSKGDVRGEFLPKDSAGKPIPKALPVDAYPQYSFALSLRRAKTNTNVNGAIDSGDLYSDSLYELRVMVFRNFDDSSTTQTAINGGGPIPRSNIPIREFLTLIDVGPGGMAAPAGVKVAGRALNAPPP